MNKLKNVLKSLVLDFALLLMYHIHFLRMGSQRIIDDLK